METMQSIRLAALVILAAGLMPLLAAVSKDYLVFVGTGAGRGSKGIYAFRFDGATGKAGPLVLAGEATSPSFLAVHPNGRYLYAISEVNTFQGKRSGGVMAFKINAAAGTLHLLNEVSSGATGPCHISFDKSGKYALVADYAGGAVAVFPILSNGKLGEASSVVQHKGKSVNPRRQEAPHAHGIIVSPDNRFVLAADLGLDEVLIYKFDATTGGLTPNDPAYGKVPAGAGARHLVFNPNGRYLYVVNEMGSSVTTFAWDAARGALTPLQTVSSLPQGWSGDSTGGEIQILPNGKAVYASNRGHDSIAVFAVDPLKGTLTPIQFEPSGGRTPRNFNLDPTGTYLFSAGQDSDNITIFKVNPQSGKLSSNRTGLTAPNPQCIDFLPLR